MPAGPLHPPARAFFLDAAPGKRFCLYPPPQGAPRGAVLHVPAYAAEMNKSRRMLARPARPLAAQAVAGRAPGRGGRRLTTLQHVISPADQLRQ